MLVGLDPLHNGLLHPIQRNIDLPDIFFSVESQIVDPNCRPEKFLPSLLYLCPQKHQCSELLVAKAEHVLDEFVVASFVEKEGVVMGQLLAEELKVTLRCF
jgi:hypothetical protein